MADRVFDRTLPCGCLVSSDGGGGCIPCPGAYEFSGVLEASECAYSWQEWMKSKDYILYLEEVKEKNQLQEQDQNQVYDFDLESCY